jgi:hypothetical protein
MSFKIRISTVARSTARADEIGRENRRSGVATGDVIRVSDGGGAGGRGRDSRGIVRVLEIRVIAIDKSWFCCGSVRERQLHLGKRQEFMAARVELVKTRTGEDVVVSKF